MNKIRLKISTPYGTFFDKDIDIVTLKTPEGYIGLQCNRLPFISSIEISSMTITEDSENKKIAAIGGGIVFVEKTFIDIFTDDIQWHDELNKTEIEKTIEEAKKRLETEKHDNVEKHKIELTLKKALNKLSLLGGK